MKIVFNLKELQDFLKDLCYVSYSISSCEREKHYYFKLLNNGTIQINRSNLKNDWEEYDEIKGKILTEE